MTSGYSSWALPPHPPEAWLGGRWPLGLSTGLGAAAVLPLTLALRHVDQAHVLLAALQVAGGFCALVAGYLLLVQASVTADPVLRFVGAGCFASFGVLQASAFEPGPEGSALVWVGWLLAVPLFAAWSPLARYHPHLVLIPLGLAGVGLTLLLGSSSPLAQLTAGAALNGRFRLLMGGAAAGAAGLALLWWLRGAYARRGTWGWVSLATATAVVSPLLALTAGRVRDTGWWVAAAAAGLPTAVLALGLALDTSRGYFRQARGWRRLEHEVRALHATATLLPGRAVTPDDEQGLPDEAQVRQLVTDQSVRVALQPVVSLRDGSVVGYEALARMSGRIPTDRWFRGASRHGLASALERVTLSAALEQAAQVGPHQFLAVNVSPPVLGDPVVLSVLRRGPLERLVIEVTEHDAIADYNVVREVLDGLRADGARVAVDDTGAGFASLRHVLLLQPDIIKLDISLARDICSDRRSHELVAALAAFAEDVGALVLAEGVETQDQAEVLAEVGVHLGQGWHLGVPVLQ